MRSSDNPSRKVTSFDVARQAGVSRAAVSRTFTPDASVSPETREKVHKAAKELGYRVNYLARSLINRRSDLVGDRRGRHGQSLPGAADPAKSPRHWSAGISARSFCRLTRARVRIDVIGPAPALQRFGGAGDLGRASDGTLRGVRRPWRSDRSDQQGRRRSRWSIGSFPTTRPPAVSPPKHSSSAERNNLPSSVLRTSLMQRATARRPSLRGAWTSVARRASYRS